MKDYPCFYKPIKCELCEKEGSSLKCMFDLVPPIYNHYPHLHESDVLYLCNYCHKQLDKTKTNFLAKNPNWHKYTPEKQQITTKTKCEKEKKRLYDNAIKDIMQQYEKENRFNRNTYQLFSSSPNIIDTECLKSPTGSSDSCNFQFQPRNWNIKMKKFV